MLLTRLRCLVRGFLWRICIRLLGGRAGAGLMVDKGATLRYLPHRGIRIGRDVYLGRGVVIDVPHGAILDIGDHALVSHYTILAASKGISIGNFTQIAELCSIRDSDHGIAAARPIKQQPLITNQVTLEDDVWVARGSAILRGSHIGFGAIIGANSLVKGRIESRVIAIGAPARALRRRS